MEEGTVCTGVCLSTPRGAYPGQGRYPRGQGRYPPARPARTGQISRVNTCCSAGGMPLAFTQEGFLVLLCSCRLFDSLWFVFVTQMNHIPMKIEFDQDLDWLSQQTIATCNVEPSFFNDWFSGHLNYQIEHQ